MGRSRYTDYRFGLPACCSAKPTDDTSVCLISLQNIPTKAQNISPSLLWHVTLTNVKKASTFHKAKLTFTRGQPLPSSTLRMQLCRQHRHEYTVYSSTHHSQTRQMAQTKRPIHAHSSHLCLFKDPFGCHIKLTIPRQHVSCSPSQRPTPLPGRSEGKHRRTPRVPRDEMLPTLSPSQRNVRGGGAWTCPLLHNLGGAVSHV